MQRCENCNSIWVWWNVCKMNQTDEPMMSGYYINGRYVTTNKWDCLTRYQDEYFHICGNCGLLQNTFYKVKWSIPDWLYNIYRHIKFCISKIKYKLLRGKDEIS